MSNGLVKSLSFGIILASAALSNAQVSFQSGNGQQGQNDNLVSVEVGPASSDFATFDSSTFTGFAGSSAPAVILPSLASGWVSSLGAGSTAQWVGISSTSGSNSYSSNTGLFAISFNLQNAMSDGLLSLTYSVDDQLGGSNNQGLYLDGNAIPNSSSAVLWNGQIANVSYNVGPLASGTHTLYFDDVNSGSGPAGIIFQGTVQSVPEPASWAVFGIGALGLIRRKLKKS